MISKKWVTVAVGAGFLFQVNAQVEERAEKAFSELDPDAIMAAVEVISVGDQIAETFNNFSSKRGISYGSADSKGRIYYMGKETVAVGPEHAQWGKQRSLAFEKAMLNAQAEFVRDQFGKQSVKMAREMFEDMSDNADEFPEEEKGRLAIIAEKILMLTDAKLNTKLQEVGVDPSDFKKSSPEQKKALFSDAYTKTCLTKAIGDMSGLFPVQTFEANDGKGTYKIGVIVLYSPKLKQLAYDIAHNRPPLLSGSPKKTLAEVIPSSPEVLADQFGVRVMFNEKGEPCVVSYGQWSHNYTGKNERMRERRNDSTMAKAREIADSYITLFLSASMSYENEQETGEILEEVITKDGDGNIASENISTVIDKMNTKIKVTAKADLAGRGTFRTSKFKHPSGHEISTVVRVWTMTNLETTTNVRNWKPEKKSSQGGVVKQSGVMESSGVKSSQEIDLDDF